MTITPAYGRDYKSKAAVLADWLAHKDFLAQPTGRYVNRDDADEEFLQQVVVRYKALREVRILRRTKDGWRIN